MEQLNLGVARKIITPAVGCALMGYRTDFYSDSLHDDLTATAFFFCQGEEKALLVNLTLCNFHSDLCDVLRGQLSRETGVPKGAILISCTHTHSGPVTGGVIKSSADWGLLNRPYIEETLFPAVLQAAAEAQSALRPVTMAVATGESLIGINRRQADPEKGVVLGQDPCGSFDSCMTVLAFRDERGNPYANLIHYACHGTCAGAHRSISRDWSGIMVDGVEAQIGGTTAFFNGAAGDAGPRLSNGLTTGRGDYSFVYELGEKATQDAVRILKTVTDFKNVPLRTFSGQLELPLQPRPPRAEAEQRLEEEFEGFSSERNAYQRHYQEILNSYDRGEGEETSFLLEEPVIRLGDCALYALPFELFSGMALKIRACSPVAHTLCLGYTNGSLGYFPTKEELSRGGYEVNIFRFRRVQPFAENADEHLIAHTLKNLKE